MYVPEAFAEREQSALHVWMQRHAFALLVTARGGAFEATHVPLWLDPARGPHGTLLGHVARANPHWRSFDGATRALAVFSGPHAYVSPRWYRKPGVPTWNYVAVHAEGAPRVVDDPEAVHALLGRLTDAHDGPGGFDAVPADLVGRLSRGVVAFELPIERLTGKAKLSQNKGAEDRAGVVAGLRASGEPEALAIAALVERVGGAE
jgi:transcriptional regulator